MQTKFDSSALIYWYNKNRRALPFRLTNDPYKIWISEIMLQQTQMMTVIPFYERWVNRLPTIETVAKTNIDFLLKLWEGLGYYRRCQNFYQASKIVVNDYKGVVPSDYDSFIGLPGVGDYTAGAVLSISFGIPIPAIDGNVKRVMARLYGFKHLTRHNGTIIYKAISSTLRNVNPSEFNQGLMELGALVCTSESPKCFKCPVSKDCKAYQSGNPTNYPKKKVKRALPHFNVVTAIIWRGDTFYIQKRSEEKMLGGLWEFPGGKVENGEKLELALLRELKEECNFNARILKKATSIKHRYSHYSITMHCYYCEEKNDKIVSITNSKWIKKNQISQYSFPKANHKIFNFLNKHDWNL
tara:strand:- start:1657 stop:2721 length:1065 start_codon:yes stop_codon:yes gene_type:complete